MKEASEEVQGDPANKGLRGVMAALVTPPKNRAVIDSLSVVSNLARYFNIGVLIFEKGTNP